MKTRDIIKYCFASTIAIVTIVAITGMTIAKNERRARDRAEAQRIRAAFARGGVVGELPDKINSDAIPKHAKPQSETVRAEPMEEPVAPPASPFFAEVAKGYICPCDDCDHPLETCGCGHAIQIREIAESARTQGKTVAAVRAQLQKDWGADKLTPK